MHMPTAVASSWATGGSALKNLDQNTYTLRPPRSPTESKARGSLSGAATPMATACEDGCG